MFATYKTMIRLSSKMECVSASTPESTLLWGLKVMHILKSHRSHRRWGFSKAHQLVECSVREGNMLLDCLRSDMLSAVR